MSRPNLKRAAAVCLCSGRIRGDPPGLEYSRGGTMGKAGAAPIRAELKMEHTERPLYDAKQQICGKGTVEAKHERKNDCKRDRI